jgi:hypothetical protein
MYPSSPTNSGPSQAVSGWIEVLIKVSFETMQRAKRANTCFRRVEAEINQKPFRIIYAR